MFSKHAKTSSAHPVIGVEVSASILFRSRRNQPYVRPDISSRDLSVRWRCRLREGILQGKPWPEYQTVMAIIIKGTQRHSSLLLISCNQSCLVTCGLMLQCKIAKDLITQLRNQYVYKFSPMHVQSHHDSRSKLTLTSAMS